MVPDVQAQTADACRELAARFAEAPEQLSAENLVTLSQCVTLELAARTTAAAAPEGESPNPVVTEAPLPPPVPPNVFPSPPVASPVIASPIIPTPEDAAAPPPPAPGQPAAAPQPRAFGQWPPPARWGTWPDANPS